MEFAYNRSVHFTMKVSPFQVVYDFNPRASIDWLPLPPSKMTCFDASQWFEFILKMHETTKLNIEKMNEKYRIAASKGREEVKLEPGDLVWLHLRKERFSELRKSKLMSRAADPFKILAKINDNAYKLELPLKFGVSPSFNISDLRSYSGEEDEISSRTTSMQDGEDDSMVPQKASIRDSSVAQLHRGVRCARRVHRGCHRLHHPSGSHQSHHGGVQALLAEAASWALDHHQWRGWTLHGLPHHWQQALQHGHPRAQHDGLSHDLILPQVAAGLRSDMILPHRVATNLRSGLLR
jgi:hypothetical protein